MRLIPLATLMLAAGALSCAQDAGGRFLEMIRRPRVPLAASTALLETKGGVEKHSFEFQAEAGERVPGLLVKAAGAGRLPAVIVLHGTGGRKESHLALLNELAARGFAGIAMDGRHHGARTRAGSGSREYVQAMLERYRTGKGYPFLYDTVWDVMRLVDYLETRPDVDAARIGAIGFSKGGMELYLAAAVDPRIRVAVPCIGVQSFGWALDNDAWQSRVGTFRAAVDEAAREAGVPVDADFIRRFYDRVAPGVYSDFDGPKMVPLIAPRPMLVINGDSDARTPMPGLLNCIRPTEAAYRAGAASPAFRFVAQKDTGHKVTPAALAEAVEWFVRWLTPSPASN